jgi:hypothetical protein
MNGRRSTWLALVLLVAFATSVAWPFLFRTWTPADDGVVAQSAERLLLGELPHRDYGSLWSGGADVLNAIAFKILGTNLASLRIALFAGWLVGLLAMFSIARRMMPVWAALVLCATAAEWTLPFSPHPLPSWHTLWLALCTLAAVVQWLERRRPGWLTLAGALAAAGIGVKITGLYLMAAIAMFLVWLVQEETPEGERPRGPFGWYALLIVAGLLGHLALCIAVASGVGGVNAGVHYLVPIVALDGLLIWREWRLPADAAPSRFRRLVKLTWPFAAGAAVVLGVWLAIYAAGGGLAALYRGLFVTPQLRFEFATYGLPGLRSAGLSVLPIAALLIGAPFVRRPLSRGDVIAGAVVLVGLFAMTFGGSPTVNPTWYAFRLMTTLCAVLCLIWLSPMTPGPAAPSRERTLTFLFASAAAMSSYIQIPFALYAYFLYFVPILLLAIAALVRVRPTMPREVPAALLAYAFWFGLIGPESIVRPPTAKERFATLAPPRGGIRVPPADSALYAQLAGAIDRRAAGEWIYVWHDSPEVYFMSGKRNPTRTFFEAFEPEAERTADYLKSRLTLREVRLVVLTDPADAVRPLDPAFRAWVDSTYPGRESVGRFTLRWRDSSLPGAAGR